MWLFIAFMLAIFVYYTYKFVLFIGIFIYIAFILWIGNILGSFEDEDEK